MKFRSEIGRVNGRKYKLIHDKRKNQQACDYKYENEWRWFLHVESYYIGDFKTKQEALRTQVLKGISDE